jgi:hypothetical protein
MGNEEGLGLSIVNSYIKKFSALFLWNQPSYLFKMNKSGNTFIVEFKRFRGLIMIRKFSIPNFRKVKNFTKIKNRKQPIIRAASFT